MLNCSEPTSPALISALHPVFNMSSMRPVIEMSTPTNVEISFILYGILGVDEKAQLLMTYLWLKFEWQNEFVSWDPIECGTDRISLPRTMFWVPDMIISEFMDENTAPYVPYVYLFCNGTVQDAQPVKVVSSCNLNIYTFPFDTQNCPLTFKSYAHFASSLQIELSKTTETILQNSKKAMGTKGEWELVGITAEKRQLPSSTGGFFDELRFYVSVRRRPLMYLVNLLVPSSFLITVDLFGFMLPPQSVDRSLFKMTLILGYTVFLLIMNDLLPITGNSTPLINVFLSLRLVLMVASLFILITNLLCGSLKRSPVPRWLRVFVLHILGHMVLLPPKTRKPKGSVHQNPVTQGIEISQLAADQHQTSEEKGPLADNASPEELRRLSKDLQAIRVHVDQYLSGNQDSEDWNQQLSSLSMSSDWWRTFRPAMGSSQHKISFIAAFLFMLVSLSYGKLPCKGTSGPTYESLLDVFTLKPFRPVVNLSNPTATNISFTLYAVLGVNEKTQILTTFLWLRLYWHHEFLVWDPDECDGVTKISLPVNDLWSPDIIVYEFVDDDVSQACPYVYVNHTGHIRWDRMLRLVSACNLKIFCFPFDVQNCTFTFGSYMHTIKDVRVSPALSFKEMSVNSKRYLEASGEWELVDILGETSILQFGIDEWDIITFWVVIKRRPVLYVVNLLIPSSFLMLIDILSFYLPPHSVDRASFKMTLILGYTVFLLIMNDLLPSTANGTPIIGIYFSVCLALMVISLLETVIITNVLHNNSMKNKDIPHWVRVVVLKHISKLICYQWTEDVPPPPQEDKSKKLEDNTGLCIIHPRTEQPTQNATGKPHSPSISATGTATPPELQQICQYLSELHAHLASMQKESELQDQWCHVAYILDFLLFRIYLLLISCYALVIICMWCIWISHS
ncbi:5-hydroxytryptamine receptor 3A-like [Thalassophryne amazonica]|uniref:5-hydroxytryptamine receptor 3A-like n=1 Tax=Thalassophryne amazonica TaxID=390379 RepID=UPI0014726983|nr:5-hydroxytryptamine receptor 3A-like [Thalassophryne amazonica]